MFWLCVFLKYKTGSVCVLSAFSHKCYQPCPSPRAGRRALLNHIRKGASTASGGCTPTQFPDSGCEEAIPVTTESSMSLSEVTKTHKKTTAFRGTGGVWAECRHRPPWGWPHPCPEQLGGLDSLTGWFKGRFPECGEQGFSGGLWNVRVRPAAAAPDPSPPVHCVRSPRLKMTPVLWSLYTVQQRPRRRKPSGARPEGMGRAGAVASLTGAASFLRRP